MPCTFIILQVYKCTNHSILVAAAQVTKCTVMVSTLANTPVLLLLATATRA